MQSTKPPYTSIRSVPAETILGNSGGATAAAQALDASTVRTVIGLGTAATAAAGDFEPAGSIAALSSVYQPLDSDLTAIAALTTTTFGRALLALADAAAGRTALGLGTAATAAIAATGTDRSVPVRSGTSNTFVDSTATITAGGVLSATQVNSTGDIQAGATGSIYWNTRSSMSSPTNGTVRVGNLAGTNYVTVGHNGTNPILAASSGTFLPQTPAGTQTMLVQAASGQSAATTIFSVADASGDTMLVVNGTGVSKNAAASGGWDIRHGVGFSVRSSSNHFNLGNVSGVRWCGSSGDALGGSVDTAIYRNAAGVLEINNGTSVASTGQYGSLYTAAHRVYDSAKTNYLTLSHDGTNGVLSTSSGDLSLSPASGVVSIPTGSHLVKWGSAGSGLCLRLTAGSNPQLDVRDHTNSIYGRVRADTYFFFDGSYLYGSGGTPFGFYNNGGSLTTLTAILRPAPYTFATVPSASSNTGSTIRITDRAQRQAYSDGTNWRWVADDVIIS